MTRSTIAPSAGESDLRRSIKQLQQRETDQAQILSAIRAELRAFERALARQRGERVGNDKSNPATNAGSGNVERVAEYLRVNRRASQAAISHDLGMNSGTVFWAVHALQQAGRAHTRGEREGRSPVWHYGLKRGPKPRG